MSAPRALAMRRLALADGEALAWVAAAARRRALLAERGVHHWCFGDAAGGPQVTEFVEAREAALLDAALRALGDEATTPPFERLLELPIP
jgi:hypothetical protein